MPRGVVGKKRARVEALSSDEEEFGPPTKRAKATREVAKSPRRPRKASAEAMKRVTTPKKPTTKTAAKKATPKKSPARVSTRKGTPKTPRKASRSRSPEPTPVKPQRRLPPVLDNDEVFWKEWKKIFLIGTEWENYDAVYDIEWDFDHLNEHLEEGFLAESPNIKYIFGTTECK